MRPAPLSWLFAPVYVAALATGAKSFRNNPIIGSPALNRAGLHVARMRIACRMAERRRERLAPLISAADRAAFERDGFIVKRDFLPEPAFAAVRREALEFEGPARQQVQGDAITRRIALDRRALSRLPGVRALVESPEWLGLVRYVGSSMLEPLLYIQTIFAQACEAARDPQTRLHADTFHPTVKAWFFLTDTGEDEGPFVYVPGSHRPTRRRLAWERRASLTARHSPDPELGARLAANCRGRSAPARPRRTQIVRGAEEYADCRRYHGFPCARRRGAALCPRRDLGLWSAQPVSAVAGARRRRHAHGQGSCRAALLVGHGSSREVRARSQSVAPRRHGDTAQPTGPIGSRGLNIAAHATHFCHGLPRSAIAAGADPPDAFAAVDITAILRKQMKRD